MESEIDFTGVHIFFDEIRFIIQRKSWQCEQRKSENSSTFTGALVANREAVLQVEFTLLTVHLGKDTSKKIASAVNPTTSAMVMLIMRERCLRC